MLGASPMTRTSLTLAGLLLSSSMLAGLPAKAHAQETSATPEVIVVEGQLTQRSATKSDIPIAETPRSISIETRQDLWDKGALNLADAYVYTPGVIGDTYGYATRGDWVMVRGLSVPEYRDSLQALFGSYNNTRSDIYTLEQVEILRGPAAVLYGQGSPGGLVNVVSKQPHFDRANELVAEVGNYNRKQVAADFTGPLSNTLAYRLVGVYRDSDTQIDHVKDDGWVIAPSLTWQPQEGTRLTLLANFQKNDGDTAAQFLPIEGTLRPAPNGEYLPRDIYYGEPGFNQYITETQSYTLLAEHAFNANWSIDATARYTDGDADYNQVWHSFIGGNRWVMDPNTPDALYKDGLAPRTFYRAQSSSEQFAIDTRVRGHFTTGALDHSLLIGAQYQDVETQSSTKRLWALGFNPVTRQPGMSYGPVTIGDEFWLNPFNPTYGNIPSAALFDLIAPSASSSETKDLGIYLSDQIELDNWIFNLGLRHDRVETGDQDDEKTTYSVGVMYRFDNGLSPYANYSESFEPVVGTRFDGSQFDPQEGRQYEIGLKYQPDFLPGAIITAAYFDIEQTGLLAADPDHPNFQAQLGEVNIDGYELDAQIPWQDFAFELSYSHIETETSAGHRLASIPENQASLWATYRPSQTLEGFKAGLGVRYVGENWNGADTLKTPSYTLLDAMVGYEFDQWDLTLNARNLTDKDYIATCLARGDCFLGEQRTVVARLAYRF